MKNVLLGIYRLIIILLIIVTFPIWIVLILGGKELTPIFDKILLVKD